MKKSDFVKSFGGFKSGAMFEVLNGPQVGRTFEITGHEGIVDPDGFSAFAIKFNTGEKEVCAKSIIYDAFDNKYEFAIKRI